MPSIADLEFEYLGSLGATGTLPDRRSQTYTPDEHAYFAGLSGLVPAAGFSTADHKVSYYRAETGSPMLTLADAERLFWETALA